MLLANKLSKKTPTNQQWKQRHILSNELESILLQLCYADTSETTGSEGKEDQSFKPTLFEHSERSELFLH